MYWTRVLLVDMANIENIEIKEVETDLLTDKTMKQIRKSSVREIGTLIFDPEEIKKQELSLTFANYKLTEA